MRKCSTGTLLDDLALTLNYPFVSSLRDPDAKDKSRLVQVLHAIQADEYPLFQWNDALAYLTNAPAQDTPDKARNMLIARLSDNDAITIES